MAEAAAPDEGVTGEVEEEKAEEREGEDEAEEEGKAEGDVSNVAGAN